MMAAAAELESSLELSLPGSGSLPPARSRIFKIIVIGDSNVGKTCLTYRFCAGRFPQRTEATIGVDFRERAVTIDGERIKVAPRRAAAPPPLRPRAPRGIPCLRKITPRTLRERGGCHRQQAFCLKIVRKNHRRDSLRRLPAQIPFLV